MAPAQKLGEDLLRSQLPWRFRTPVISEAHSDPGARPAFLSVGRAPSVPSSRTHLGQAEGPDSPPLPLVPCCPLLEARLLCRRLSRACSQAENRRLGRRFACLHSPVDLLAWAVRSYVGDSGQILQHCVQTSFLPYLPFFSPATRFLCSVHIPGTLPPSCFRMAVSSPGNAPCFHAACQCVIHAEKPHHRASPSRNLFL